LHFNYLDFFLCLLYERAFKVAYNRDDNDNDDDDHDNDAAAQLSQYLFAH